MALWYDEVFDDAQRFGLKVERTLFMGESEFQRVAIVETTKLGRALLVDDLWPQRATRRPTTRCSSTRR